MKPNRIRSGFLLAAAISGLRTAEGRGGTAAAIPEVLASSSPGGTLYSCFLATDPGGPPEREACCGAIAGARDPGGGPSDHARCLAEMAEVPSGVSLGGDPGDTARYAWAVPGDGSGSAEQRLGRETVRTISPYHKTAVPVPGIETGLVVSRLGAEGGMHRLFHHEITLPGTPAGDSGANPRYYLYVTVPSGMFIDLDDPFEAPQGGRIEPAAAAPGGDASRDAGFEATCTTGPSAGTETGPAVSFRARLHAAAVCDIEQPSFASGQHLLVWELEVLGASKPGATERIGFATKLHLRYPRPSPDGERWIDLPAPVLVDPVGGGRIAGWEDPVRVAAGRDGDHDWIVAATVGACLVGVAAMVRDISGVSLWDDA
ncbi:unnamed protein product [Pseudo-nitzschia multistriata]|uniref:Uncharacterized protein n=1 Tax=Pseudo-nitzschia multistriata TaxID=183589 RepID=A0A448ZHD3_9STRA|nr:unnamed protein product [Pseudo-nitzschia multistriata]